MPLGPDAFAAWLDRYVAAWRSNDGAAIGDLFSTDAMYDYRAGTRAVHGREAIVADWLASPDEPGSFDAKYEPLAIDGEVHVAIGWTRYFDAEGAVRDEYSNVFVCRFDDEGRCASFTEWWMRVGGSGSAAAAGGL